MSEREEVFRFLARDPDVSWSEIARCLGRHRSTIQREVIRHGGRNAYRADPADTAARACRRGRPRRLADPVLAAAVNKHLKAGYSPAGTARLVGDVSTETIYQGIYDGTLGLDPTVVLRTRRPRRRLQKRARHSGAHWLGQRSWRDVGAVVPGSSSSRSSPVFSD